MAAPQVPIDVDPETGIWRTDGLAMIYLPRHFFVNNHKAVERALGAPAHAALLDGPGRESAVTWCRAVAAARGLDRPATFRRYLERLSARGWGRFELEAADPAAGRARVGVRESVFVHEYGGEQGRPVCYMFAGWLAGAYQWSCGGGRLLTAEEVRCGAAGAPACVFEVRPAAAGEGGGR